MAPLEESNSGQSLMQFKTMDDCQADPIQAKNSSMAELEDDLIVEILVRLPIRKIVQFKTVSKQWQRLISSDTFAFQQAQFRNFDKSSRRSSFFVLRSLLTSGFIVPMCSAGQKFRKQPQINLPHMETNKRDQWVGYVLFPAGYGIYCLFEFVRGNVFLWNPTTKETKVLPASPYYPSSFVHMYHFGTMDYKDGNFSYKVGRMASKCIEWLDRYGNRRLYSLSLELYSSKTKSWKLIPDFASGEYMGYADHIFHCANLNGRVHWVIQSDSESEDTYITTFDYETEVFGRIKAPSPPLVALHYDKWRCLVTLFDHRFLCLVLFRVIDDETSYVDIWVMREYGVEDSWTKEYTVGPITKGMEVLGFSSKLHGLFLWHKTDYPTRLVFWDCKSSNINKYSMVGGKQGEQHMQVVERVRSLVSVLK